MRYRRIGKSGLRVSEIALGSWMTDLSAGEKTEIAKDVIRLAFESGVNFFDCADAYGNGQAEQFLGSILSEYERSKLVVSSKVFFPTGSGINERGLSRKHIMEGIDRSLKYMKMDYLDIYYCHRFDQDTDMEETLTALSDLVSQGKILYYGVSEGWTAARLLEAVKIISEKGLHPMTAVQPQYHMMDRYIEHEIMDVCEKYAIGITSFSPLAQGLLTGKYKRGETFPENSRATWQSDRQINSLLTDENLDKVERMSKIAHDMGMDMSVMAMAWLLRRPVVSSIITGASRPEQLKKNLAASEVELSDDVLREIESILKFTKFKRHVG